MEPAGVWRRDGSARRDTFGFCLIFLRQGHAWARSLCFGGGGRAWLFISCPALWARLAPRPGVHTSHPPAVFSCEPQASGGPRRPIRSLLRGAAGAWASGAGPAGSPRELRGSRLAGALVPKRLLLVSGPGGRRLVLRQGPGALILWELDLFVCVFISFFFLPLRLCLVRAFAGPSFFEHANHNILG